MKWLQDWYAFHCEIDAIWCNIAVLRREEENAELAASLFNSKFLMLHQNLSTTIQKIQQYNFFFYHALHGVEYEAFMRCKNNLASEVKNFNKYLNCYFMIIPENFTMEKLCQEYSFASRAYIFSKGKLFYFNKDDKTLVAINFQGNFKPLYQVVKLNSFNISSVRFMPLTINQLVVIEEILAFQHADTVAQAGEAFVAGLAVLQKKTEEIYECFIKDIGFAFFLVFTFGLGPLIYNYIHYGVWDIFRDFDTRYQGSKQQHLSQQPQTIFAKVAMSVVRQQNDQTKGRSLSF